ncbi:MAG: hypothetical protein H0S85_13430 [Desulfovibrionaceae bacterium]|nr:hypothetical protein [Desulfovibrionaceae bacterium]
MSPDALLVFHGDVRDFLAPGNRADGVVVYPVTRRASIKDVIESLGVPHTEVDAIEVTDGGGGSGPESDPGPETRRAVDFSYLLAPGDGPDGQARTRIDVRGVCAPMDLCAPAPLRPVPLPREAFVADANVGRLATYLRLIGWDTRYDPAARDADVARIAREQRRAVLTMDRALLHRSAITHARLVRAQDPFGQLVEVVRFFGLRAPGAPFSRCLRCNGVLAPVDKAEVLERLLPLTKKYFDEFHRCPDCGRIYWQGSHHGHMRAFLERLARATGDDWLRGPPAGPLP